MAVTASEIHDRAAGFVVGRISLRQFEDWFVPATWDQHRSEDRDAGELADTIELCISEYTDGLWSKAELRQQIGEAIRRFAGSRALLQGGVSSSPATSVDWEPASKRPTTEAAFAPFWIQQHAV